MKTKHRTRKKLSKRAPSKHRTARTRPTPAPRAAPIAKRQAEIRKRVLRVLWRMRRGESLSQAARAEHVTVATVLRHAGSALYQSSRNKQWKVRREDRLSALMNLITPLGPQPKIVRGKQQRSLLGRYNVALRHWREDRSGAEEELSEFEGLRVANQPLITDTKLLATLEDAGVLDFPELYVSIVSGR